MKRMKKMMALALAMVMVFAMSITSLAAGDNSITVDNAKKGETYKIYKMLDLSVHVNEETTDEKDAYDGFSYTFNDEWKEFWTTGTGKDYIDTNSVGDKTYVVWKSDKADAESMVTFGKEAAAWAKDNNLTALSSITVDENNAAEFKGLENGYYMITSTYGTAVTIGSTPNNANQTIKEKNPENTVEKQVKEELERNESGNSFGTENDAQVGDTVTFRSKVDIIKNTINVAYHDTMTDGLTFSGADSVVVYTDEAYENVFDTENYEVVVPGDGDETFKVTFENDYVTELDEDVTLYIKYTAVLNNNAVVDKEELNTPSVTWGDDGKATNEPTKTYTHKFEIKKYDGADADQNWLAGAKFQLYTQETEGTALTLAVNEAGNIYRVVNDSEELPEGFTLTAKNEIVTLATENIAIEGVDSDDYWLEETEAPIGYNKLEARVKVQVDAENNLVAPIENMSGTMLPSTGGMGTTMLYIVGGVLVLAAVVLMVMKNRTRTEK